MINYSCGSLFYFPLWQFKVVCTYRESMYDQILNLYRLLYQNGIMSFKVSDNLGISCLLGLGTAADINGSSDISLCLDNLWRMMGYIFFPLRVSWFGLKSRPDKKRKSLVCHFQDRKTHLGWYVLRYHIISLSFVALMLP